MSFISTGLKMSFKEYNKFIEHSKKFINNDVKEKFNICDEDIENGNFINNLFNNFEMDNRSISLYSTYGDKSIQREIIEEYIEDVECDEEDDCRYDEIGFATINEETMDIDFGGYIDDAPFISIDNNMNFKSKTIKPGALKIIID